MLWGGILLKRSHHSPSRLRNDGGSTRFDQLTLIPFTSSSNRNAHQSTLLLFAIQPLPFVKWENGWTEGEHFSDGNRKL